MSAVEGRVPEGAPRAEVEADVSAASRRRDGGASFSGAIAGRPGRPPVALVVFLFAIGALVIAGLGGRQPESVAGEQPAGTAAPPASATAEPVPTLIPVAGTSAAPSPGSAPIVVSEAGSKLALTIRRHPETMFVHGDVYPPGVTWVFVNLLNSEGRVAAWSSVSIPGGAGPAPDGRPTMRFDVEMALPDWSHGPLWVQATAYDDSGTVVAQEQLGVWPDGSPVVDSQGRVEVDGPDIDATPEAGRLGAEPLLLSRVRRVSLA